MKLSPEGSTDPVLTISTYVVNNLCDWIPEKDTSIRGEGPSYVSSLLIFAGNLITGDLKQPLTKGKSYSYPSTRVQGHTPVSFTNLLYACMAPDQFYLQKKCKLPEEYINRIVSFVEKSKQKKVKRKLGNIEIIDFDRGINTVSEIVKPHMNEADINKVAQVVQAFIGSLYIASIRNALGRDYAAITIAGSRGTETFGFDLCNATKVEQSKHQLKSLCIFAENEKVESVALYQGHNKYITQHLVIQSDRRFEGSDADCKIAICGSDSNYLVHFYKKTIAKGIPVNINCTDGIDRTGIILIALLMLHSFTQNPANNFTHFTQAKQQQWLISLIQQLKTDRGPYFLRLEKDVIRAIVLGYLLIATYTELDFQQTMRDKANLPSSLQQLLKIADKIEPAELKVLIKKVATISKDKREKAYLKDWLLLVDKRILRDQQFMSASQEKGTKLAAQAEKLMFKKKQNKEKMYTLEEAPLGVLNQLLIQGFDLNAIELQVGKDPYSIAFATFLKEPSAENFTQICFMTTLGSKKKCTSIHNELVAQGYSESLIALASCWLSDKYNHTFGSSRMLIQLSINQKLQCINELRNLSKTHDLIKDIERSLVVSLSPEQQMEAIRIASAHISKFTPGTFSAKSLERGLILKLKSNDTEFYVHPNAISYFVQAVEFLANLSKKGLDITVLNDYNQKISVAMQSSVGMQTICDNLRDYNDVNKVDIELKLNHR